MEVIAAPADLTDPHPDAHRHEFLFGCPRLSVVGDLAHRLLEQLSDQCDTEVSRWAASTFDRRTNSSGRDSVTFLVGIVTLRGGQVTTWV